MPAPNLRYGKKEGFANSVVKRLHDVGTRFQQKCPVSVHENVPEYEEAGPFSSETYLICAAGNKQSSQAFSI